MINWLHTFQKLSSGLNSWIALLTAAFNSAEGWQKASKTTGTLKEIKNSRIDLTKNLLIFYTTFKEVKCIFSEDWQIFYLWP